MTSVTIRGARSGDGEALARIHAEMAAYYTQLAPRRFRSPFLDGFAEELDAQLGLTDDPALYLVAESDGDVVGALFARLVPPRAGAEREIASDLGETRLSIEYLATAEAHRRRGVGTRLVEAAEAWGRARGATVAETSTYPHSPLSVPFWGQRMAYEESSVSLRKRL
jgi:GNAT superfamily N-acetyltransferase